MKQTPCTISISFAANSGERRTANLTICDSISGCKVVQMEIDLYQWALALTSLSDRPAIMEFRSAAFGKVPQYKEHLIRDMPLKWNRNEDAVVEVDSESAEHAIRFWEVDGWRRISGQYGNSHRQKTIDGIRYFLVGFTRFVDPTPEALAEVYVQINERREHDNLEPLPVPEVGE